MGPRVKCSTRPVLRRSKKLDRSSFSLPSTTLRCFDERSFKVGRLPVPSVATRPIRPRSPCGNLSLGCFAGEPERIVGDLGTSTLGSRSPADGDPCGKRSVSRLRISPSAGAPARPFAGATRVTRSPDRADGARSESLLCRSSRLDLLSGVLSCPSFGKASVTVDR
jgi:hypothetical protein